VGTFGSMPAPTGGQLSRAQAHLTQPGPGGERCSPPVAKRGGQLGTVVSEARVDVSPLWGRVVALELDGDYGSLARVGQIFENSIAGPHIHRLFSNRGYTGSSPRRLMIFPLGQGGGGGWGGVGPPWSCFQKNGPVFVFGGGT
jgi:hypothetical protein